MPAEWEKHEAIWLAWPYDPVTFPDRVEKAEATFAQIIQAIHPHERVELLVRNQDEQGRVAGRLRAAGIDLTKINFRIADYADVWTRDFMPSFVVSDKGEFAAVKWIYNAYGKKFRDLLKDNNVWGQFEQGLKIQTFAPGIHMEGGAIDVNGQGTLLTTKQCLLNSNRNPDLSQAQTEEYLRNYLGVWKIIWLEEGIVNDHTDGHIDDVARFVNEHTVLCAYEEDQSDENYEILQSAWEILQKSEDQDNKAINLVKIPMPKVFDDQGFRLPASYINFYIGNGVVLVPTFNVATDQQALSIFNDLFPEREIISINASNMIYGGGTIHCASQQQPIIK